MSVFEIEGARDHVPSRFTERTGYVKILLLGAPCSGKTSIYNLLSNNEMNNGSDSFLFSTTDIRTRVCHPIDSRLEWMNTNFRCTSTQPLKVNIIDTPSIIPGSNRGKGLGLEFLNKVRNADLIYIVLRGFTSDNVSSYDEDINPVKDLEIIQQELMLHDLQTCEAAIASMEPIFKLKQEGREMRFEYDALFKVWHILAGFSRPMYISPEMKITQLEKMELEPMSLPGKCKGKPLRFAAELFDDQDIGLLRKYRFFTAKECVYLVNISRRHYLRGESEYVNKLREYLAFQRGRNFEVETKGLIKSCPVDIPIVQPVSSIPRRDSPSSSPSASRMGTPGDSLVMPLDEPAEKLYSVTDYFDNSLVVPISVDFEYSLYADIGSAEGHEGLLEYFQANPYHVSVKQPLMQEIAHAALGFVVFYTLELLEPDSTDGSTVQTGLSSVQFSTQFGLLRAVCVSDGTYAPQAAGYIDINVERGFISAQVACFEELVEVGGDLNILKREKKVRQQGRKYAVNNGDIISFDHYTPEQLLEQQQSLAGSSGAAR